MFKSLKKWYKEVDPFELLAIVFIIIGIIVIVLIFFTSSFDEFFDKDKHPISQYAELIGGFVGSLWALAGVLLFYASLASQQKDIEEQRNLLVRQIDEVVKQTDEFRKQSDIQAKQQYENTYFQLLRFHNEIITSIVLEISDVDFTTGTNKIRQINGRKSFVEYYDIYKRFFNTQLEILMTGELTIPIIQRIVDNSYRQFFDEYQADLGHYFRNLYNILYFIDNLKDAEKSKFYLELLHAQLSNFEIALLYFHCASSNNKEFKELLEKYELLSTIPDDEIISMSKRLYNPRAFGKDEFESEDEGFGFGGGYSGFGNDLETENSNNNFNFDFGNGSKGKDNDSGMESLELSFSENDILSKFASLSMKKGGSDNFEDSYNEYSFEDSLDLNKENFNNVRPIEDNLSENKSLLDKLKNLSSNVKIEDNDFDFDNFENFDRFNDSNDLDDFGTDNNQFGKKDNENKLLNNQNIAFEENILDSDVNIFDSLSAKLQNINKQNENNQSNLKSKLKDLDYGYGFGNENFEDNLDNDFLGEKEILDLNFDEPSDVDLESTLSEFNKPTPSKSDLLNKLKSINELEKSINPYNNIDFDISEDINEANQINDLNKISNMEKLLKEHSLNDYDNELSDFLSNQNFDFNLENEINPEENLLEENLNEVSNNKQNVNENYVNENITLDKNNSLDEVTNLDFDFNYLDNNSINEDFESNLLKSNNDTLGKAEKVKLKDLSKLIQKRR